MWPVTVVALGGASLGTRVWRKRGQIYVSAVVKATFALVSGGPVRRVASEPLHVDEQPDRKGHGLITGGDMAPYLAQTDFWMVGHARGVVSPPDASLHVHVGMMRDGALIYEKYLPLAADLRENESEAFYLGGWGPLSKHWPVRSRFLGAQGKTIDEGAFLDLPDSLNWAYFQTSPLDQRLPPLRGDEWLLLQNIFSETNCLKTRLCGAVGAAKVYGRSAGLAHGHPLRMGLDSLQIDTDRRVISLLWRGYFPVSSQALLRSLWVMGGVELPGQPLEWTMPIHESIPPKPLPPPGEIEVESENPLENRMIINVAELQKLSAHVSPPAPPHPEAHETKIPSTLPPPRGPFVIPVRKADLIPAAPPLPTVVDREEDEPPLARTRTLSQDEAQTLAERPAMPFMGQSQGKETQEAPVHSLAGLPFVEAGESAGAVQAEEPAVQAKEQGEGSDDAKERESVEEIKAEVPKPELSAGGEIKPSEALETTDKMSLGEIFLALMRN